MAEYFAGFIATPRGFDVVFPDLPECTASGSTLEESYASAATRLAGLLKESRGALPAPSSPEAVRRSLAGRAAVIRPVNTFDAELVEASRLFASQSPFSQDGSSCCSF